MGLKLNLLSLCREFMVYHHKSLEFRAKVFAAIISVKLDPNEEDFNLLSDIADEIYGGDKTRKDFLVHATREYVAKVKKKDHLTLDALLLSVDRDLKMHPRYAKKIDFAHLHRFMSEYEDEFITQQQVYDFFISEVKNYLKE